MNQAGFLLNWTTKGKVGAQGQIPVKKKSLRRQTKGWLKRESIRSTKDSG